MNQEIPSPIRNALARQARAEVHPSPDVLTSFMERTLSRDERDRVTDHLALCSDCREAVFVASNAAEDVIADNKELEGAAHQQPALVKPRRRWTFGLAWASAAAAMLLVGGTLIRQRLGSVSTARQDVSTVASNKQPPAVTQPPPSRVPSFPETQGKAARTESTPPKTASSSVPAAGPSGSPVRKSGQQSHPNFDAAPAIEIAQNAPSAVTAPEIAAPMPGSHSAFVGNQADTLSRLGQTAVAAEPTMSMRAYQLTLGQWRISADGHVEHRAGTERWTRMYINEATTFHVVSVVGGDVWAGGDGGALYCSRDGGQHWNRSPLVMHSGAEDGTITSIHFDSAQQGTVLTAGGSRWSTSDGGITWSSQ